MALDRPARLHLLRGGRRRGSPVRLSRQRGRLAGHDRSRGDLLARSGNLARLCGRGAPAPARLDRAQRPRFAPDPARQLPHAHSLAGAPLPARPVLGLFSGRVRGPHRHQADADRARRAPDRDGSDGRVRLRRRVLHGRGRAARRTGLALGRAGRPVDRGLCRRLVLVHPPLPPHRHEAGRRALGDDGAHRRQLHQHPDRKAVQPFAARALLRARGHAALPRSGLPADAARRPVRLHRQRPAYGSAGRHGLGRAGLVERRRDRDRRGGRRTRHRVALGRHDPLGDVGAFIAVRECRHRAGRHQVDRPHPPRARPRRRDAAGRDARRSALRGRVLRL